MDNSTAACVRLTRIQKLIGERMLESKRSKPCFYIERKADVTDLLGRRHKLSKALGVKITSNAFLIRALALAARQYPLMLGRPPYGGATGRLETATVLIAEAVNVGFAVNSSQGLVVPVVQDADRKTLAEIAMAERLLTRRARSNQLTLADIEGESIALSNLGAYGTDTFLGIVPPATSAILAVGGVMRAIVPEAGRPVHRKLISLSLAADHRIIDPVYAAKFLGLIAEQLAEPDRLI